MGSIALQKYPVLNTGYSLQYINFLREVKGTVYEINVKFGTNGLSPKSELSAQFRFKE